MHPPVLEDMPHKRTPHCTVHAFVRCALVRGTGIARCLVGLQSPATYRVLSELKIASIVSRSGRAEDHWMKGESQRRLLLWSWRGGTLEPAQERPCLGSCTAAVSMAPRHGQRIAHRYNSASSPLVLGGGSARLYHIPPQGGLAV